MVTVVRASPIPRFVAGVLLLALLAGSLPAPFLDAAAQSGQEVTGGPTFNDALPVVPLGLYHSYLPSGSHYYRFPVAVGEPINIEIRPFCNTGNCPVLSSGSFPASDNFRRLSFRLLDPAGTVIDTANSNQGDSRVMVSAAAIPGEYRFLVTEQYGGFRGSYSFCFLRPPQEPHPCPDIGMRSQDIIYGGAPSGYQNARVLLMPPPHGDLGNPFGPTALDYLDAALSGIHEWVRVLHEFADDHPQYSYLKQVSAQVFVFDGTQVFTDYDIVILWVPTGGSQFRGAATSCLGPPRCIVLTLHAMAPRSGQSLPDYPEYDDVEAVVKHEFAHVWGLGHTLTWTEEFGPDLMNSPASFVYGDGSPVGDGGERTGKQCISTLNLYVAALVFRHLGGQSRVTGGSHSLPDGIPYAWYC